MLNGKKVISSILLLIILFVGILAGCSNDKSIHTDDNVKENIADSQDGEKDKEPDDVKDENPFKEHIRLDIAMIGGFGDNDIESSDEFTREDGEFYDPRAKQVAEKFNVSFNYQIIPSSSQAEKLRSMLASNTLPDVVLSSLPPSEYIPYIEGGVLRPLPEDLEDRFPNISALLSTVTAASVLQHDGKWFCLPRPYDPGGLFADYTAILTYRKDLVKEAGLQPQDTYTIEELYDLFKTIHDKYPDITVFDSIWQSQALLRLGVLQYCPDFSRGPFRYSEEEGEYVFLPATEDFIEGLKWAKKFYDAGFLHKEFYNIPDNEARAKFPQGNIFCYVEGGTASWLSRTRTNFGAANPDKDPNECVDLLLLLNKDGKHIMTDNGNYWSEWIFSGKISDEKLERFLHLWDFMCSDEGIALSFYGIEGVHYKEENGKLVSLREIDPETGSVEPFNTNPKFKTDQTLLIWPACTEGPTVFSKNPKYSEGGVGERTGYLYNKRQEEPHYIIKYDPFLSAFEGERYKTFTMPVDYQKIVVTTKAEDIEKVWRTEMEKIESMYKAVLAELNSR